LTSDADRGKLTCSALKMPGHIEEQETGMTSTTGPGDDRHAELDAYFREQRISAVTSLRTRNLLTQQFQRGGHPRAEAERLADQTIADALACQIEDPGQQPQ
jgi:hypothetical protein